MTKTPDELKSKVYELSDFRRNDGRQSKIQGRHIHRVE